MKPRILIVALVAVFVISVVAIAQSSAPPSRGHHSMIQRMTKELGLTPDQVTTLKPILEKYRSQAESVRSSNLPADQKRAQLKQIRSQEKKDVFAVLTPDQQTKAEAMWKQHRAKKQEFVASLGLTDAQRASIKSIRQDARAQIMAIRNDSSLDSATKQARIKAVRTETRDKVLAVLTPDQQAKAKAMKAAHSHK